MERFVYEKPATIKHASMDVVQGSSLYNSSLYMIALYYNGSYYSGYYY